MQRGDYQGDLLKKPARCKSRMLTFRVAPLASSPPCLQTSTTHCVKHSEAFWDGRAILTACWTT